MFPSRRFLLWFSVGLSGILGFASPTYAQTRTRTGQPYPTVSKSVSWSVNIPYVTGGGPEQQLDLYVPTDRHGEPLVVYIHGGGFDHGDKAGDSINPNNLQWIWQGYAMASINYRLIPHALWPAQIEDCKAAIRWLKKHASYYGYLPDEIAVVGESAGGHLAAMLGTTSGRRRFDVGENLDQTSDVVCALDLFGPTDLTRLPSLAEKLLGPENKNSEELRRNASPIAYVHEDEPPILIVHGTDDQLVPYEQAELLADAIDKVHAPYRFHTVVGGGHNPYFGLNKNPKTGGFDAGDGGIGLFEDPAVEPLIIDFLHQHLNCHCGVE
ncbi:MAG: alpha/beta hydrolase [Verrucomicrobia bacterium]|nr:alpha/beta hydrolase [Verrucomicrobiota bacterium]